MNDPSSLLLISPQGRFADVRERPARFEPGLGHLAARVDRAIFLPVAIEYVFWEESLPEILMRFGEAITISRKCPARVYPTRWNDRLAVDLELTQDALAKLALKREPDRFRTLERGGAGQGGVYDIWQRLRAIACNATFEREHGRK